MIKILKSITVYCLALMYVGIGIKHFTEVDFFLVIVPPYMPYPEFIVYVSGLFEIIFGVLFVQAESRKKKISS